MSKKDYIIIANAISEAGMQCTGAESEGIKIAVQSLIINLSLKNPRFDADKFVDACGITS